MCGNSAVLNLLLQVTFVKYSETELKQELPTIFYFYVTFIDIRMLCFFLEVFLHLD